MPKKTMVIANWKMNPETGKEAEKWFSSFLKLITGIKKSEIIVCPPFVYLEKLSKIRSSKLKLGGQDLFPGDTGPFTGEVSAGMLEAMGLKYVILGHSERRSPVNGIGETNELINKKVKSALSFGIVPILCVGEKERDQDHNYFEIVKTQVLECLRGISKDQLLKVVVAYEPIWSISSTENRRDATADDAREMSVFIRKVLSDVSNPEVAHKIKIIYGGSVNPKDAGEFIMKGEVDGLLVGKASLDPKKFFEIVKICEILSK
jgi:triosephosphate isomerase